MSAKGEGIRGSVKLAYGFGLSAEGIKNNAFNLFLFFYYTQIIGLGPIFCGVALLIGLVVDAVTDPLVGAWSDGVKSRLGRRHPFMFAASLPLSACFLALYVPPKGVGQELLFAWLTLFVCGTRFSMTLFAIPHQSLVAELTDSYDQRTQLQSLRTVFAWIFGLLNAALGYTVFLADTKEYPRGVLNPAGYLPFAIWGALFMLSATLVSSLGTRKAAIEAQPDDKHFQSIPLKELPAAIVLALRGDNYRTLVIVGLCSAVSFGMTENLGNYINTFFWGLTSRQIFFFIVIIFLASLVVLSVAGRLVRRFGKHKVAMVAVLLPALTNPTMVTLRILGVLPPTGSRELLSMLCVSVFFGYGAIIMTTAMIGAMIADTTDEHELRSGRRQEGLLYAGNTFILKASSGLGTLVAGVMVKLVGFPERATPDNIDPAVVTQLGAFAALVNLTLGFCAFFVIRRYALSRTRHTEILSEIEKMRARVGSA